RTFVNGEKRQDSSTSDMIFSVPEIISYTSRYITLEPWDLIITGTPSGVVLGMPEPKPWLKPGDELALEIDGLGRLENTMCGPAESGCALLADRVDSAVAASRTFAAATT